MLKQLLPPSRQRLPHYSFMRPGDFLGFLFLIAFTVYRFYSAWRLELKPHQLVDWHGVAVLQLIMTIGYAWLRIRRRNICGQSGEMLLAVFVPQGFSMAAREMTHDQLSADWTLAAMHLLLLPFIAYQVWRAPKDARELEELLANAEEEARKGTPAPRFTHTNTP
jgi:hypothetical protein